MTDLYNDDKSDFSTYIPGENQKYKTQDDLAKGAFEKDRHIKNIEKENAELRQTNLLLREDNDKKANLEEYIDRIKANQPASNVSNPPTKDGQPPIEFESLFDERIRKYEAAKTREQNSKTVIDALKERYGNSYMEHLNAQTEELGLTKEAVNYLAETSPKALIRQLGLNEAPKTDPFQAPPRTSPQFAPKAAEQRTWSYYKRMKKDNPILYSKPTTQAQMHKDYQFYGKAFEDGDFLSMGQGSAFE
jgi:hypothetical protein